VCQFVVETGDASECAGGLELHHAHIEFSLQNGVDLSRLERQYPGISDASQIGAWVESAENLVWYCASHHRGRGGVHTAAASDYEATKFVKGLIS
jgi:succinate dehydrogenase/fumarate reductase flavoprotein subunit